MMTSTSKIVLSDAFPGMATRSIGDEALSAMLRCLQETDVLELDFGGASPSPSFADQAIGGLAATLGINEFRRRIKIRNAPPSATPLLRLVILQKASQYLSD